MIFIDPFKILKAELEHPLPKHVMWWYNRFGGNAVVLGWKTAMVIWFWAISSITIVFDQLEMLGPRNITLWGYLPFMAVIVWGFVAWKIKNQVVKKRIEYLGVSVEEYNKVIQKMKWDE